MSKIKYLVILIFCLSLLLVSNSWAQTTTNSSSLDLEIVSVDEVSSIPSSWGLWWGDVKHSINLLFTFDPVAKATKRLKFSEEKLKYAEYLADNYTDEKSQKLVGRLLDKANKYMEKVESKRQTWLNKDNNGKLIKDILTHQLRRERIIDKLEEKLPEKALKKIRQFRVNTLDKSKRLLNALSNENLSSSTLKHLQFVKNRIENHLQSVKKYQANQKELLDKKKNGKDVSEELDKLRQQRQAEIKQNMKQYREIKMEVSSGTKRIKLKAQNKNDQADFKKGEE